MSRMRNIPGFTFDSKKKLARFDLRVPGSNGNQRRRKQVEVRDMAEALEEWKKFKEEISSRTPSPREPQTLSEYVETFWPLRRARIAARTYACDQALLKHRLLPFLGKFRLDKINAAVVRDLVGWLKEQGYAPETINNTLTALRKILRDAVEREELAVYPIRGRLPRQKTPPLRLELSPPEMEALIAAFDDFEGFRRLLEKERSSGKVVSSPHFGGKPRVFGGGMRPDGTAAAYYFERFRMIRPLVVVALETGLRKGDLLGLQWEHVDLASGWIRIRQHKTGEEVTIPLSEACRASLLVCRNRTVVGKHVFTTEDGRPYSMVTVKRYFAMAKRLAGISRRFRFHDLRHTFGSRLASAGVSLQVIAKALGHSTVKMSERYARPSEESVRQLTEALNRTALDTSVDTSPKRERTSSSAKAVRGSNGVG